MGHKRAIPTVNKSLWEKETTNWKFLYTSQKGKRRKRSGNNFIPQKWQDLVTELYWYKV